MAECRAFIAKSRMVDYVIRSAEPYNVRQGPLLTAVVGVLGGVSLQHHPEVLSRLFGVFA